MLPLTDGLNRSRIKTGVGKGSAEMLYHYFRYEHNYLVAYASVTKRASHAKNRDPLTVFNYGAISKIIYNFLCKV